MLEALWAQEAKNHHTQHKNEAVDHNRKRQRKKKEKPMPDLVPPVNYDSDEY